MFGTKTDPWILGATGKSLGPLGRGVLRNLGHQPAGILRCIPASIGQGAKESLLSWLRSYHRGEPIPGRRGRRAWSCMNSLLLDAMRSDGAYEISYAARAAKYYIQRAC